MKHHKKWEVISSEKVLTNKFFNVRKDVCKKTDGDLVPEYYVKQDNDSVIILPQTRDGKYIVEALYRHPLGRISFDFPAGSIQQNETPEHAAKRELLEETGYKADNLILLGKFAQSPGWSADYFHLYFVPDVWPDPEHMHRDEHEKEMALEFLTYSELTQYITQGKIDCTQCALAFYLARKYIERNK